MNESQPINIAPKYIAPKLEGLRDVIPPLYGVDFFGTGSPFAPPFPADRNITIERLQEQGLSDNGILRTLMGTIDREDTNHLTTPLLVALVATEHPITQEWCQHPEFLGFAFQVSIVGDIEVLEQRRARLAAQSDPKAAEVAEKIGLTKKKDYRDGAPKYDHIQTQINKLREFQAAVEASSPPYPQENPTSA